MEKKNFTFLQISYNSYPRALLLFSVTQVVGDPGMERVWILDLWTFMKSENWKKYFIQHLLQIILLYTLQ